MVLAALGPPASCRSGDVPGAGTTVGIDADGCPEVDNHGVGAVLADGRVLTVAHVVAGAQRITVRFGARIFGATLVAFDPRVDLALLRTDEPLPPGFAVGTARTGEMGRIAAVRATKPVAIATRVVRPINLRIEDIYLEGQYDRPALELEATIEPGDSGSPVVVGGRLVGIVALRNREVPGRAYAIDPETFLATAANATAAIGSGPCARVG